MQIIIRPIILLLLLLINSSLFAQDATKKIVHTIDFAWLEGCEKGKGSCNPVQISRQHITNSIQLVFPKGGTASSVYLYSVSLAKPVRQDHKRAGQGPPVLDLTGLPDGTYSARMLACEVGGGFSIIIKTN